MIKLIGCVLIISACTQMGCAMATDKIRQMKYLKLLRRLIFETRAMVEGGMTFGEIILKLSLQKDYSDFTNTKSGMQEVAKDDTFASDFLGGQNPFTYFSPVAENIKIAPLSAYDQGCNEEFLSLIHI